MSTGYDVFPLVEFISVEENAARLEAMWITPPSEGGFSLRVPSGSGEIFTQAYQAQFDSTRVKVVNYTVKKGETVAAIAKRYHLRINQIMEANDLKTPQLRVGQQLLIVLE